jgi:tetratricopeptide (TPR) repeat protein
MRRVLLGLTACTVLVLPVASAAQDWRGSARLVGKVSDTEGNPIEGAEIKLFHTTRKGGTTLTTDAKGKWGIGGIATGAWDVEITAKGFNTAGNVINIPRVAPLDVRLTKAAPAAPPPELVGGLDEADRLYESGDFKGAREAYENALVLWADMETGPENAEQQARLTSELHMQIARCYSQEENVAGELEHLQHVLDADPTNSDIRMLMAQEALKAGLTERGEELLGGVDDSTVNDPAVFYNIAVMYINQSKPERAIVYLTKTVETDPEFVDGYFQRGLAYFGQQKLAEAQADLERVLEISPEGELAEASQTLIEAIAQSTQAAATE